MDMQGTMYNSEQTMIQENYPEHSWTHANTDGSAANAVQNKSDENYILYLINLSETNYRYSPTGKFCFNYSAEIQAK